MNTKPTRSSRRAWVIGLLLSLFASTVLTGCSSKPAPTTTGSATYYEGPQQQKGASKAAAGVR